MNTLPARSLLSAATAAAIALTLVACGKPADQAADKVAAKGSSSAAAKDANKDAPKAPAKDSKDAKPLQLADEDTLRVKSTAVTGGPAITGSLQAERRADLRAEISSVVMHVHKENGDTVKRGELLVRLDDTAFRESLAAADASVRAATQAHDQAKRQFDRATTLRQSGMVSAAALEDAETRRNAAQSELEAARSRVVAAKQQLTRTEVRAPFDGVVTDRKVSAGDTAQIGKELLKVIDPASMRVEALVSADSIGQVKPGQSVKLRVNGFDQQEFSGKVRRVNPSANATTRQVEILIDFTDKNAPRVAGLYAEGRILAESTNALTVPAASIVREGDRSEVWKVEGGVLKRVPIVVSERDARSGDFALKSGLVEGDQLIRYPTSALKDGQKVETLTAKASGATPVAASK